MLPKRVCVGIRGVCGENAEDLGVLAQNEFV